MDFVVTVPGVLRRACSMSLDTPADSQALAWPFFMAVDLQPGYQTSMLNIESWGMYYALLEFNVFRYNCGHFKAKATIVPTAVCRH
jgi:hypothetical protein